MNKAKIFATILTILVVLTLVKPVSAAVRCETQYGGGQICVTTGELQIIKQICVTDKDENGKYKKCDVDKNAFADFLSSDHAFATSDFVTFKLTIKNVGDNTLHNVKVIDTLPDFLFFTGVTPSTFHFDTFNPGVAETKFVEARVISESQLKVASDCDVNTAEVTADENQHDKDSAKLCVTKQVLGVTSLPKTGPSDTFLLLTLSGITGLAGVALIRLGKKTA